MILMYYVSYVVFRYTVLNFKKPPQVDDGNNLFVLDDESFSQAGPRE
jgi:hypothetical protein